MFVSPVGITQRTIEPHQSVKRVELDSDCPPPVVIISIVVRDGPNEVALVVGTISILILVVIAAVINTFRRLKDAAIIAVVVCGGEASISSI